MQAQLCAAAGQACRHLSNATRHSVRHSQLSRGVYTSASTSSAPEARRYESILYHGPRTEAGQDASLPNPDIDAFAATLVRRLTFANQRSKEGATTYTTVQDFAELLRLPRDALSASVYNRIAGSLTDDVITVLGLCQERGGRTSYDAHFFGAIRTMMHRSRAGRLSSQDLVGDAVDWAVVERHTLWIFSHTRPSLHPDKYLHTKYRACLQAARDVAVKDKDRRNLSARHMAISLHRAGVTALRQASRSTSRMQPFYSSLCLDWPTMYQRGSAKHLPATLKASDEPNVSEDLCGLTQLFQQYWSVGWDGRQRYRDRKSRRADRYKDALQFEIALANWQFVFGDRTRSLDEAWEPIREVIRRAHADRSLMMSILNDALRELIDYTRRTSALQRSSSYERVLGALIEVHRLLTRPAETSAQTGTDRDGHGIAAASEFVFGLSPRDLALFKSDAITHMILLASFCEQGMYAAAAAVYTEYTELARNKSNDEEAVVPMSASLKFVCAFGRRGHEETHLDSGLQPLLGSEDNPATSRDEWTKENFVIYFEDLMRARASKWGSAASSGDQLDEVEGDSEDESEVGAAGAPHEPFVTSRGPSSNDIFHIINALRRVSDDDLLWVLEQYDRVQAKFGPAPPSIDRNGRVRGAITDRYGREVNKEGWTGWRLSPREEQLLQWLRDGKPRSLFSMRSR